MRRTVLLTLGVWMGMVPRAYGQHYPPPEFAVSLSASPQDPWVNHVSAVADSGFSVYLWLTCGVWAGGTANLDDISGYILTDYERLGFEPFNGGYYIEEPPTWFGLAPVGCPESPHLLGRWLLANPQHLSSGAFCLSADPQIPPPSCWITDCNGPAPDIDIAGVTGFAVGDSSVCAADNGCALPTAVEGESWGRTKSTFRDGKEERP